MQIFVINNLKNKKALCPFVFLWDEAFPKFSFQFYMLGIVFVFPLTLIGSLASVERKISNSTFGATSFVLVPYYSNVCMFSKDLSKVLDIQHS